MKPHPIEILILMILDTLHYNKIEKISKDDFFNIIERINNKLIDVGILDLHFYPCGDGKSNSDMLDVIMSILSNYRVIESYTSVYHGTFYITKLSKKVLSSIEGYFYEPRFALLTKTFIAEYRELKAN